MLCMCVCFFFFKQKTAYEMRISDWSSDVCSSDLSNLDLLGYLWEADSATHISTLFSELRKSEEGIDPRKYSLLILRYDLDLFEEQLEIQSFDSMNQAILQYNSLEKSLSDQADIVLVGSKIGRASGRERVCQYV